MKSDNLFVFFLYFINKYKFSYIFFQIFATAWTVQVLVWPCIFSDIISVLDNYSNDRSNIWMHMDKLIYLWIPVLLGIEVMYRFRGFIMAKFLPNFEASIKVEMFEHIVNHSYSFFTDKMSGNVSKKISDMSAGAGIIMQEFTNMLVPVFLGIICSCFLFLQISYLFCAIVVGWCIVHATICFIFAPKCADMSSEVSSAQSVLSGRMVDIFSNILNVLLFDRKEYEIDNVKDMQKVEKKKYFLSKVYVEKISLVLCILGATVPMITLMWGVIEQWSKGFVEVGDCILVLTMSSNLGGMVWVLGFTLPRFFRQLGVCKQALEIVQGEHEIKERKDAKSVSISGGGIEFRDVDFGYEKNKLVFKDKSFIIDSGSRVGIVGFSGSGKSTLIKLILRVFDVQRGTILIDGHDIKSITMSSLRKCITMIPQEPYLFHRSIRENICYGSDDSNHNVMIEASKKAQCHDFIMELPDKYDTLVGEQGAKLSGGQRQRISIARAIMRNSPILIMDEATSALDSVTERYIQDSLELFMENRTAIVIAHRLSTLHRMNRILVLDKGKIVEDGTHQELLDMKGHYYKMHKMQENGFLVDEG